MSKKIIAVAAALIAGSTLANTANAGVRVGFGFPLGSFVARETMGGGYGGRDCERPRRTYQSVRRPVYNPQPQVAKRAYKAPVVAQPKYVAPTVADKQAGKVGSQASATSDAETNVTEIAKTPSDDVASNDLSKISTTAILAKAPDGATKNGNSTMTKEVTSLPEVVVESKPKAAAPAKAAEVKKADLKKVAETSDNKKVCRRFSAALGDLVETACE